MSPRYECDFSSGAMTIEGGTRAATDSLAESLGYEPQAVCNWGYEAFKRAADVILSFAGLILLSPLLMLIALAIKLSDGGPVLYTQLRVGQRGKTFRFYKFRSMIVNAEELKLTLLAQNQHSDQRTFKMADDPRITWIGRLIRRASLDELPQLFNILSGDMTLVGPRPPLPAEVTLYSQSDWRRLEVRPGLTCIWQVSGRSNLPFREQVRLDLQYIDSRSVMLDAKILLKTLPAVVSGRGAY